MKKQQKNSSNLGNLDGLPWSQRQRLRFLEALAYWRGSFRRADLLQRFDIGVQRVSDDIREYMRLNTGALVYDRHEKLYRASPDMEPIFEQKNLEEAIGLLPPRDPNSGPWFDRVNLPIRQIAPKVVQQLFRAVAANKSIEVRYASLNSATFRWRWITPHAFAHDGYRWHVRAFCHDELQFKDFVVGRMSECRKTGMAGAAPQDDTEWQKIVLVKLDIASGLSEAEHRALALDFGLDGDQLVIPIRSALSLYALTQLGLEANGKRVPCRFSMNDAPENR